MKMHGQRLEEFSVRLLGFCASVRGELPHNGMSVLRSACPHAPPAGIELLDHAALGSGGIGAVIIFGDGDGHGTLWETDSVAITVDDDNPRITPIPGVNDVVPLAEAGQHPIGVARQEE